MLKEQIKLQLKKTKETNKRLAKRLADKEQAVKNLIADNLILSERSRKSDQKLQDRQERARKNDNIQIEKVEGLHKEIKDLREGLEESAGHIAGARNYLDEICEMLNFEKREGFSIEDMSIQINSFLKGHSLEGSKSNLEKLVSLAKEFGLSGHGLAKMDFNQLILLLTSKAGDYNHVEGLYWRNLKDHEDLKEKTTEDKVELEAWKKRSKKFEELQKRTRDRMIEMEGKYLKERGMVATLMRYNLED